MKLTVVVPTFNCASTISDCAQSIFRQTRQDVDVVFVDGGSTDATASILRDVCCGKLNAGVVSEPDGGIYDAMNKAIARSRGEWLYFLGGDDILFADNIFCKVLPLLTDDFDIVYGDVEYRHASGQKDVYGGEFTVRKLARRNICHQAVFYRATLFRRFGLYDRKYPIFADWAFNLQVFPKVQTKYIPNLVASCYFDGRSSSVEDPAFYHDKLKLIFFNTPATLNRVYAFNLRRLLRMLASFWERRRYRQAVRIAVIMLVNASIRFIGASTKLP